MPDTFTIEGTLAATPSLRLTSYSAPLCLLRVDISTWILSPTRDVVPSTPLRYTVNVWDELAARVAAGFAAGQEVVLQVQYGRLKPTLLDRSDERVSPLPQYTAVAVTHR